MEPREKLFKLAKEQDNMLTFNNYFLRGLLTVKTDTGRKPLYIAEYHTGGDVNTPRTIAIYDVTTEKQPDGTEYYDKKYITKKVTKAKFKDKTLLGRMAHATEKVEPEIVKEYELPLFITTIEQGKDTFTGHVGDGFYEETRTHFDTSAGDFVSGDRTGVFICLDSFKWADPNYRFNDVREAIREQY